MPYFNIKKDYRFVNRKLLKQVDGCPINGPKSFVISDI